MFSEIIHQKNCKKFAVVTDCDTGEIACGNCGAVSIEKMIDSGPESTWHSGEHSRTGQKISLKMVDMGLSTIMAAKDRDAAGRSLSGENRRMFHRLRMWDRNSRSTDVTRSFQKAFVILDAISSKLGLPEPVVEETAHLFRKIAARKILAGRSTLGIICAATYIICRLTGTPRTLQDITDVSGVKKKTLQRIYRHLTVELGVSPKAFSPREFIPRISTIADTSEKTERLAFKILNAAQRSGVSASKNPVAMAAASVHLAALLNRERISQTRISEASGISSVTIRDRTREIREVIGGEIYG